MELLLAGLEALLAEHTLQPALPLPQAVLLEIGGFARETSKAVGRVLRRIDQHLGEPLPGSLQFVVTVGVLPIGVGSATSRLVLLMLIGTLSSMRSTTDAFRSLLARARVETGRSRSPRPTESPSLYPICAATRGPSAQRADGSLICAELCAPHGLLLLTPEALRCTGASPDDHVVWELPLTSLLLIQQRKSCIHILAVHSQSAAHHSFGRGDDTQGGASITHEVTTHSEDDATRLHEILRLAGLNARGQPMMPSRHRPLLRSSLFTPPVTLSFARL